MTHTSSWPRGRKRKHVRLRPATHKPPSNPGAAGAASGKADAQQATTAQSLPQEWAFDTGLRPRPFPDEAASLLPGPLAATRTGLTPASDDELTTQDQPPTRSTSCLLGARQSLIDTAGDQRDGAGRGICSLAGGSDGTLSRRAVGADPGR
jgi:hypothetical protein